jgi:hypothetical protein
VAVEPDPDAVAHYEAGYRAYLALVDSAAVRREGT